MKKFLSIVLIMSLLFSMGTVSFAAAGSLQGSNDGGSSYTPGMDDYKEGSIVYFKYESPNYDVSTATEMVFNMPYDGVAGFDTFDESTLAFDVAPSFTPNVDVANDGTWKTVKISGFDESTATTLSNGFVLTWQAHLAVSGRTESYKIETVWTDPLKTLNMKIVPKPAPGSVVVTKAFVLNGAEMPESIDFYLNGETETANEGNSWTVTFDGLEAGSYTLTEEDLGEGWSSNLDTVGSVEVTSGEATPVTVTNTYTPETPPPDPDPGTVTIYKTFEGYEGDMPFNDLVFNIDFTLYDSGDGIVDTMHPSISGNDWSGIFNDVEPGTGYYVVEAPFSWEGPGYWTSNTPSDPFAVSEGGNTDVYVVNTYHLDEEPTYTVDIEKTVSPTSQYTGQGPVSYTITFENTSNITVYDWVNFDDEADWEFDTNAVSDFEAWIDGVFMTDDGGNIFGDPINMTSFGGFEPGDKITITFDYDSSGLSARTSPYTNTVTGCAWMGGIEETVNGTAELGDIGVAISQPVCDTDDASFTVRNRTVTRDDDPGIKIDKDVNLDEASVGDTVVYTIEVDNIGEVDLRDVTVEDSIIGVVWEIGDLDEGDSVSKDFDYEIQEGDFADGEFVNLAEVTADSSEGSVSDEDTATVNEEIIEVPDEPDTPETPPVIVPPAPPAPQALPKTGQVAPELFYGLGSILMAAGYGLGRKKKD